ncbi:MAG: bifunctional [glutamate--ammonia ligase]-adenylyl-L-tyrosine phosphorylase/[glutamate--ammonia-ligase] adenylyltransferase [Proteobacteria bacterium]|nr:bifunctional [glutamate--ammonia ligase]-adenylyl-L-tyrosine phosphorylase/[glutamate--ammonia-ligase] adenylyltransferase [Pseudomonadota bacterium]
MRRVSKARPHHRGENVLSHFQAQERQAIERDPVAMEALSALASFSPVLTQALAVRRDLARWLLLERAFEQPAAPVSLSGEAKARVQGAADLAELQTGLRGFRLKELARLAVRDLTGRADLAEVMETLTLVAEACLSASLDVALRLVAERYGLPSRALGFRPVIMGMGKLGARELNYSSDVDLIYFFQPRKKEENGPPVEEVVERVFTTVTRAMADLTEDGLVFRVDLDLRPGGKDGAQVQSLETARNHYLFLGQPWERMAWLKARPVAGDIDTGLRLLEDLSPFVLRRHLDYTSIEELKALKARFTRRKNEKIRHLGGTGRHRAAADVKLSPGGIREVEFFTQALILTFGGRLPHLRQPRTLDALAALAGEDIITRADEVGLSEAYVFLRTVEHRLQLRSLTQTQVLPKDEAVQDALARSMGYHRRPWPEFLAELTGHMDRVKKCYNLLLTDPDERPETGTKAPNAPTPEWVASLFGRLDDETACLDLLAREGFNRPDAALAACRRIREERYLPDSLARYRRQVEKLMPVMVAGAAASQDPDKAIIHLERFLSSIGPRAGFFVMLEENPALLGVLNMLFGASDFLSRILIAHPGLLDSLIDRRGVELVKPREAMSRDVDTLLGRETDTEIRLGVIRRFKNDETLRIGLYDLLGELNLTQVQSQLADLADLVMARTLDLAVDLMLPERASSGAPVPLAVIGQGKLGGREMSYVSDLDLIFILGRGVPELGMEQAVRLAQRFNNYLTTPLAEGPGYETDARLRPSGRQGPLVVTPSSFARYHETSQLWERQAMLKMRLVLGPERLGTRVRGMAARAIFRRALPEDAARAIDGLRRRMIRERGPMKPGAISLKLSPGGMVDAEFLTQYLQLVHGRDHVGNVRSRTTQTALRALVAKGLGPEGLAEVVPAYELMTRLANRLGLIHGRSDDANGYSPEEVRALTLPVEGGDPLAGLEKAMAVVRRTYAEVLGAEDGDVVG